MHVMCQLEARNHLRLQCLDNQVQTDAFTLDMLAKSALSGLYCRSLALRSQKNQNTLQYIYRERERYSLRPGLNALLRFKFFPQ